MSVVSGWSIFDTRAGTIDWVFFFIRRKVALWENLQLQESTHIILDPIHFLVFRGELVFGKPVHLSVNLRILIYKNRALGQGIPKLLHSHSGVHDTKEHTCKWEWLYSVVV